MINLWLNGRKEINLLRFYSACDCNLFFISLPRERKGDHVKRAEEEEGNRHVTENSFRGEEEDGTRQIRDKVSHC